MHGRVKVRTSEEQAEAKRKEQQEKLKVYLKTTSKIFSKRDNEDHDEEALQLTGAMLERNPDFYTLWNYRREVLQSMKAGKEAEEIKALSTTELNLTQHCLQKNPKSYAAWHHRCWAMEFNPEADWKKELKLCGYFLSQDDRNFHCWNYRRFVAKKCEVLPEEELNFSTELINSNFSNYSAWHYRSSLLPLVHPGPTEGSIAEDIMLEELDLVHNAVFTDPDDQSAWFYHRWILGRSKVPLQILNVTVLKTQHKVAVLLSQPVKVDKEILKLSIDGKMVDVMWQSVSSHIPVSTLWVCILPEESEICDKSEITVEFKKEIQSSLSFRLENEDYFAWNKTDRTNTFRSELSGTTKKILEGELEMCKQLLEMEPNSKWTLFTSVLLMRALNDAKFHKEIGESIKSLKEIDSYRKNYYSDLESKIIIEDYIENLALEAREVNLASKNLSSLYHFDQFILIETVNLSNNSLKSIFPLCHLISVKKVILDNNELTNLTGLEQLQNLKILSVKENLIERISNLEDLKNCKNLEEIFLDGNPVMNDPQYLSVLEQLPLLHVAHS